MRHTHHLCPRPTGLERNRTTIFTHLVYFPAKSIIQHCLNKRIENYFYLPMKLWTFNALSPDTDGMVH